MATGAYEDCLERVNGKSNFGLKMLCAKKYGSEDSGADENEWCMNRVSSKVFCNMYFPGEKDDAAFNYSDEECDLEVINYV